MKNILKLFLFLSIISCDSKSSKSKSENIIPIEKVQFRLKSLGDFIAKDITETLLMEKNSVFEFSKNVYLAPGTKFQLANNSELFEKSILLSNTILGNLKNPKLFKVIDKNYIKTLKYHFESDAVEIKEVVLELDINNNYKLARFNYYLTTKDGKLNYQPTLPISKR